MGIEIGDQIHLGLFLLNKKKFAVMSCIPSFLPGGKFLPKQADENILREVAKELRAMSKNQIGSVNMMNLSLPVPPIQGRMSWEEHGLFAKETDSYLEGNGDKTALNLFVAFCATNFLTQRYKT